MRILGVTILVIFYGIYIGKMLLQRRKGIQTDQIAKGKRRDKTFYVELALKAATNSVVVAEIVSLFAVEPRLPKGAVIFGAVLGFVGDAVFALAVVTMKDSWRAGLAENDRREIITDGIYKFSRNPAFLGFDCVYLGLLLMFFNLPLLVFSLFAMVTLHLQILQEEQYLPTVFGEEYIEYKNSVCRYIGRK